METGYFGIISNNLIHEVQVPSRPQKNIVLPEGFKIFG